MKTFLKTALVHHLIGPEIFIHRSEDCRSNNAFSFAEVKHEIEVWKKAYNSLSGYSRDEDTVRVVLHRKITILETLLRKKLYDSK